MFEIEVHYRETDSFNSYEHFEPLGIRFNTLEEARECLLVAQEHHLYIKQLRNLNNNGRPALSFDEVVALYKDKVWYDTSNDEPDFSYYSQYNFKFKDQIISSFYNSVCNTLYSMKIKYVLTDKDFIDFN